MRGNDYKPLFIADITTMSDCDSFKKILTSLLFILDMLLVVAM